MRSATTVGASPNRVAAERPKACGICRIGWTKSSRRNQNNSGGHSFAHRARAPLRPRLLCLGQIFNFVPDQFAERPKRFFLAACVANATPGKKVWTITDIQLVILF